MAVPSNEVRTLLEAHNWSDTIPRLIKYARSRISQGTVCGDRGRKVVNGKTAEDFAMDAIAKVYSGDRQWDSQSYPDLLVVLLGIVKSEISHVFEGKENRTVVSLNINSEFDEDPIQQIPDFSNSPDGALIAEERRKEDEEYVYGLIDFLADDKPLIGIVECIMEGITKPKEMADKMKVGVQEIYNLKKRMGRRLREYQKRIQSSMLMKGSD